MEQGKRLDSTPVSAAQAVRDDAGEDRALDAAVAALLTCPSPTSGPADDQELLRLGGEFDAAHAAWLDAVEANREPSERFSTFIETAKARGGPTMKDVEAAWALPGVTEAHGRDDETFGIAADLGLKILQMPANSLFGLSVHARAAIPTVWPLGNYEEDADLGENEDLPQKPVRLLIQSVLRLAGVDWKGVAAASTLSGAISPLTVPAPEVDWHNPPPGFMAYPAIEPAGFINIREGLKLEAERLHEIALREVARRASAGDLGATARAGRLDHLRRQYRIAELSRAAGPEWAIPTEVISAEGMVYYEDAFGMAHRRPVADWIGFMAQRMNSVARQEVSRLFNERCVQDQDANVALDDDLRRTHRLDALHDLAFRSAGVFDAAKEYRIGGAPVSPCTADVLTPDPILALIERHRQAYAEWLPHFDVITALVVGTPEFDRAEADGAGPQAREQEAYGDLLTARSTTLAGLVAWVSYLPGAVTANDVDDEDADGVRALASICDAFLSLIPISAPQPASDEVVLPAPAASDSDLAAACIDQIARPERWDENPDAVSEKQGNEEMDCWKAVFRRAIEEPSTSFRDLAGKAYLMLADLDRFELEKADDKDNDRLTRVILREAIAMGGLTYPAAAPARDRAVAEHRHGDATLVGPVAAEPDVDQHDRAFHGDSTDLRLANREYDRLINQADRTWVKQNGGDLSAESMAAAEVARDAALARQEQAWRDLFNIRPRTNHQMWLLLRDVAMHFDAHQGMADEPDVFGALIGAADGLRADAPELVAPYDLTRLSISQLEDLADICGRQSRAMLDARKGTDESPLGSVLKNEQYRIGRLGGMASAEIERRVPANDDERNLRLETLARADLAGNGYIEPKLLSELVAAWGVQ